MDFETAQNIVGAMADLQFWNMGLRDVPPSFNLTKYSLDELIQADRIIRDYNDIRTDKKQSVVIADRMIAAIYTLLHYPAAPDEPLFHDEKKAVAVVRLPDAFFDDGLLLNEEVQGG